MSSMLTDGDLLELSGLKQGAAQAKFLQRAYGLNVPRRADGRVRVTWDAINQAKASAQSQVYSDVIAQGIKCPAPPNAWVDTPLGKHQADERQRSTAILKAIASTMPSPEERAELEAKKLKRSKERSAAIIRHHAAKRRAVKLQRTPSWANLEAILAIHEQARRLTTETGTSHHVDHIYPLQGRLVSGLHVHQNMQILTALENSMKHNKFEVGA